MNEHLSPRLCHYYEPHQVGKWILTEAPLLTELLVPPTQTAGQQILFPLRPVRRVLVFDRHGTAPSEVL